MEILPPILLLLCVGAVLWAFTVWLLARILLRPPRMTDAKALFVLRRLSPEDLGLAYETVSFTVRDQGTGRPLRIAGWWMGHSAAGGRCVLLVHGYADAKVGAIAWAPLLHGLGWNVLAVDLRAHGESDGVFSTGGYFERHDLDQVIDQVKARYGQAADRLVLFGISLGGVVAAATAALRKDLAGVVLESPFVDYARSAEQGARLIGMPGRLFQRPALRLAEFISGAHFGAVNPVELVAGLACPVLLIQSGQDLFIAPEDVAALQSAAEQRNARGLLTRQWIVPEAPHALGLAVNPQEYSRRVGEFLGACLTETR